MADDQKKILPINYTHREYQGIKQDLLQLAERYYPENFQDFSEASFGALMLDAVAYVGDQLSLYLDYNVNESFLDTAYQLSNVVRHGRILGYKNPGRPSTHGIVALYIQVPASTVGMGPDSRYIPTILRGSSFTSDTGLSFVLTENVSFSDPVNQVVVSQNDSISGAPTYYAIKAYGNVVSGRFAQTQISVGAYERFKRISLPSTNISEIISVFDSEGNQYYEVDYLAQDMVFKELPNNNYKNDNVPSILKPLLVSRKFVVERDSATTYLQFGSGDEAETNVVANPQQVAMDVFGKAYVTDTTFDPTRLSKNKNYGISPANTDLTITYRSTNPANSNVAVAGINAISNALFDFENRSELSEAIIAGVVDSADVSNETPIVGNVADPSTAEIKRRIFDTFPTQNRAVTQADYENLAYRMPAKFGSIKRVSVQKDADSLKRNLNMYVISEDSYGMLVKTNTAIKNNLKTWLEQYRMINDTVDILDPYIIDLGIDFVIKTAPGASRPDTLNASITALANKFEESLFIAEHISISEIYSVLSQVEGVLDVVTVKLNNKLGGSYSSVSFNVQKNLSPDGSSLMAPSNAIFQIKYPSVDIRGKVR